MGSLLTDVPAEVAALRSRVDAGLDAYLATVAGRLTAMDERVAPLADELIAAVRGGKRLRPVLALLGWRAGGGGRLTPALPAALALELLHACALLHDDLIDGAGARRGRPTPQVTFGARGGERYGAAIALLLGDLAFVLADELFLQADLPPQRVLASFRRFTVMREELTVGQFLDVDAAAQRAVTPELALRIAGLKSGRYSVALPLAIGATLAGAGEELVAGLERCGLPLGQAFQLRDDVLGVFGDEGETGKSVDADLAEGKRTLLVALTLERLGATERTEFEALLGRPDLDADGAARLRELMVSSGGLGATEEQAAELKRVGLDELDRLPVADQVAATLRELATYLVSRTN